MRSQVRILAAAAVLAPFGLAWAAGAAPAAPAAAASASASASAAAPVASSAEAPADDTPPPPPPPEPVAPHPSEKVSVEPSAETAKDPNGPRSRWHPRYAAEIELHATIAAFDRFFVGMGGGARVTIPVWDHTPFKGIDDDLGVGIGLDVIRYAAYKPADPAEPTLRVAAYYVPIYLQWNVWLGARASMFLEPTLVWRTADYIDSCTTVPSNKPCAKESRFLPTGALGLRFRIADHVSGTLRVGWPMASIGASWL